MKFIALPFLLLLSIASVAADWPHWRGPDRDGHSKEPSGWSDGKWLADKPTWTAQMQEQQT